ncbi:hypothetical protein FisN_10Hh283 [Fistulifera solaris]|uniref:Uncharacterized protein n=1 Tax=Fistulifera solaris TaxID=1519565 RepID=A0A1Z5JXH2_FISSO|nr:hypothetical protein FisN_10Hh283 [Fistulifera solaris]|eukprot:GAX18518.1 hypothetical protein FisN_10Hh283 [Fistulifera solaris]
MSSPVSPPPKKYVNINGVMKLNPEYQKWKASTTLSAEALPIVSTVHDCQEMQSVAPSSQINSETQETLDSIPQRLDGILSPDTALTQLTNLLAKYEVPLGLLRKLMILSEFDVLEFLVDDSGSMGLLSDTQDAYGRTHTRWQEAASRLKEMMEILSYLPFQQVKIWFLNRPQTLHFQRQRRDPTTLFQDMVAQIDQVFATAPYGSTPAFERLQQSFRTYPSQQKVARYFFGDGVPNGGKTAQKQILTLLQTRPQPEQHPVTFLSCTSNDEEVLWMKEAEEAAPYCAECDDYEDEMREVLADQGAAFPYTRGFWLICALVSACFPDDLDALDESVPFTKTTLDRLLGMDHTGESYKYYFECFVQAQANKKLEKKGLFGFRNKSKVDALKKNQNWKPYYDEFVIAPVAHQIPVVREFREKLKKLASK